MKAFIDTNLFVYATYSRYAQHAKSRDFLKSCLKGSDLWYVSWGVVYEYLSVVTQPRIYENPLSLTAAIGNVWKFVHSPQVEILLETTEHEQYLQAISEEPQRPLGGVLHDAHSVALMREHDLKTIYTADTDFHRFKGVEVVNPF